MASNPVRIIDEQSGNTVQITGSREILITETERESDVWAASEGAFNSTTYVILISKNSPLFPHKRQGQDGGRIDVTSIYYVADLSAGTRANVRIGVITRIDGTNADIKYFAGTPFEANASAEILIQPLRVVPSQIKLDFNANGTLLHGITNSQENNVAAVNTGITLDSPAGNIEPRAGDVILKYEHTSGSTNLFILLFYHNTD